MSDLPSIVMLSEALVPVLRHLEDEERGTADANVRLYAAAEVVARILGEGNGHKIVVVARSLRAGTPALAVHEQAPVLARRLLDQTTGRSER